MIEKIKKFHEHPFAQELRDVRVLGMIVFAVIVMLVSWSGVRVIETNYRLQQQIARIQEENKLKQLENRTIELENEYYKTDQFLELQARKNFGLAAPGETLILVPEEVAIDRTIVEPEINEEDRPRPSKPFYQKNFETWINFLLNRNTSDI